MLTLVKFVQLFLLAFCLHLSSCPKLYSLVVHTLCILNFLTSFVYSLLVLYCVRLPLAILILLHMICSRLQSKQQQQPAPAQPPMSTPSQASPSTTSTASQAHHAHPAVMASPPLDGSNGPHKDHTDLPPHAAHMPTHPVRSPVPPLPPRPCSQPSHILCLSVCSHASKFE